MMDGLAMGFMIDEMQALNVALPGPPRARNGMQACFLLRYWQVVLAAPFAGPLDQRT